VLTPEGDTVPIREEVFVETLPVSSLLPTEGASAQESVKKQCQTGEEEKQSDVSESGNISSNKQKAQLDKAVSVDLEEDRHSSKSVNSRVVETTSDLSGISRSGIEALLESLTKRVRDIEAAERGSGGRVADLADVDDSARAESITSGISSVSSKGERERIVPGGSEYDPEAHSTLRRQSVIIEGLTLETEELRKKCQQLENEMVQAGAGTPLVDDLSHKLELVESRLEESENYCYQVIEENVEMKAEMETLEAEIAEVQDSFRDQDAKEFKKTKWELENLGKTCRNLQLKLGKAQARASRLRQEKEEAEELAREQMIWKTTALVAAAALATYSLLWRFK